MITDWEANGNASALFILMLAWQHVDSANFVTSYRPVSKDAVSPLSLWIINLRLAEKNEFPFFHLRRRESNAGMKAKEAGEAKEADIRLD